MIKPWNKRPRFVVNEGFVGWVLNGKPVGDAEVEKWFEEHGNEVRLLFQSKREKAFSRITALTCCDLITELEKEMFEG